jgi:hypothetical protein
MRLGSWRIAPADEEAGMSDSSSTLVLVATYPDEAAAQGDYQMIKDAHARRAWSVPTMRP